MSVSTDPSFPGHRFSSHVFGDHSRWIDFQDCVNHTAEDSRCLNLTTHFLLQQVETRTRRQRLCQVPGLPPWVWTPRFWVHPHSCQFAPEFILAVPTEICWDTAFSNPDVSVFYTLCVWQLKILGFLSTSYSRARCQHLNCPLNATPVCFLTRSVSPFTSFLLQIFKVWDLLYPGVERLG